MNTERIKSFVLFSLVIMSFILTTRIWFNVSIEGFFVMPSKDKPSQESTASFDLESLLKPSKVVVHIGSNNTLLFNDHKNKDNYESILKDSNDIIKDLLDNNGSYTETNIGTEELQKIREGKAVELIYRSAMSLDYIKSLLNVDKNLWSDINAVTSIIIKPAANKIYIVDQSKAVIHEFIASNMPKALADAIDQINDKEDLAVFLSDLNQTDYQFYGKYAIAPISVVSMPIMSVKKEMEVGTKPNSEIAAFFNDDINKISTIPGADGTVTFSDREEETVKLDIDGVLEYYKYNITPADIKNIDMKEAVKIAADYVNNHLVDGQLGLNGDFYLTNIESGSIGGRTSYIVSFDYKYNGIPIITDTDTGKSAIEVEIVGGEVKRYKRNVRVVGSEVRTVNIKTFDEVLNIIQGGLEQRLNTTKSESIAKINDLSLAYIEVNGTLIPYWVANIEVESSVSDIRITNNKKYYIRAEDGAILMEQ